DPRRVRKTRGQESGVRSQESGVRSQESGVRGQQTGEERSPDSCTLTPDSWWEVHVNGGRVPTGLEAVAWARRVAELGAGEIVLTSMDADGTRAGYDLEMTRAVSAAVRIPVVASGGAGQPGHLYAALPPGGAD